GTASTAGWIPQGGGRPRLWRSLVTFWRQKVTPAERPRRGRWFPPGKLEKDNPSVMATPCHLPLHKGGILAASVSGRVWKRQSNDQLPLLIFGLQSAL